MDKAGYIPCNFTVFFPLLCPGSLGVADGPMERGPKRVFPRYLGVDFYLLFSGRLLSIF